MKAQDQASRRPSPASTARGVPASDELAHLDERLQQMEQALTTLNQRVRELEARAPGVAAYGPKPAGEADEAPGSASGTSELWDLSVFLALMGRTFMVFGGAFLLRALTDSGQLPRGGGIAVGLAYAVTWFIATDRAAGRGRRLSANFHGFSGVAIGLPLLWEASTRFGFLSPAASAAALAALISLAFAVAWHRSLQGLAGFAMLAAMATALEMVYATGQFIPFAVLLTVIGVVTLWLGYDRDWYWLRWPAAVVTDIVVACLAMPGLTNESVERPGAVIAVQLFALATYAGSVTVRTLLRRRVVIPFEAVQTLAVLAVGLGGAVLVAHSQDAGESTLGIASAILGAGAYAAAFMCWMSRHDLRTNFYFYGTLALVLTLTGCGVLLRGPALIAVVSGLAVVAAWVAYRFSPAALIIHSAIYCAIAAAVSGLLTLEVTAFLLTPAADWAMPGAAAWIALAATAICIAIPRPQSDRAPAAAASVPRLVLGLLLLSGSGAVVIAILTPVIAGAPVVAGILATLRTAVLSTAAVLLAGARRYERTEELGWLLYPVLGVTGFKLLVEDFRYSEPVTLFIALGLFGAALVATARLVKRGVRPGPVAVADGDER